MAVIKIRFLCGCGFTTSKPTEASKHSDDYKHTLIISGEVIKPEKKSKKVLVCSTA